MRATILFLLAAGACYVLWIFIFHPTNIKDHWLAFFGSPGQSVVVGENQLRYTHSELGFAFTYKTGVGGYALRNLQAAAPSGSSCVREFHLVRESDVATAQYSDAVTDGAPQITILVCHSGLSPEEWALMNKSLSKLDLKVSDIADITLAGSNGIKYISHGRFMTNVYVLSNAETIYVITGNYETQDSNLFRDFFALLGTFSFSKQ